ncbi:MAG: tetratricopeptide repeat protein [Ahrensia sp.]|nr:tetratricopeptide repeat protein [Ahrensia sp.]
MRPARFLKNSALVLSIAVLTGTALAQSPTKMGEQDILKQPTAAEVQAPAPSRFGAAPPDEAFGAFQRGLYITARNLALPKAEAGDAAAQTLLAEIYSRGLGVPRDIDKAGKYYEAAARQGVPEAQFQYALMLLKRDPDNSTVKSQAIQLMRQAADAGNAEAQFNYAQLLLAAQPGSNGQIAAFTYFEKSANQNVADAQYAIAQYYALGSGNVVADLKSARKWLEKAAQRNFETAQLELGNMMLSGVGGARDLNGGFSWINRAAASGNIAAQAALAKLYWGGIGVEPDSSLAAAWFVRARRAGLRDAVLDDFWEGLSAETQKAAIERANRLP